MVRSVRNIAGKYYEIWCEGYELSHDILLSGFYPQRTFLAMVGNAAGVYPNKDAIREEGQTFRFCSTAYQPYRPHFRRNFSTLISSPV